MTSNESISFSGRENPAPSSSDDRLSSLFSTITAEYDKLKKTSSLTAANFKPSFSNRHASKVLPVKPEVQLDRIISITNQLQAFLLLIPKQQQPKQIFNRNSFNLERHADMLIEIVIHLGSIITSNSKPELLAATFRIDDQYKLYLRYAQLITNIAEKSPFLTDSSGIVLNKLVDYLIEAAFFLTHNSSINQIDSKQLAHEIYRSLGSLVYQNGFKLNVYNLNRLLGENDSAISNKKARQELKQKDGLLFLVREQIEQEMELTALSRMSDDVDSELNCRLDLITTQLIFNLTMPSEGSMEFGDKSLNSSSRDIQLSSNKYIEDKFKVKAVYLLLRILRFHTETLDSNRMDQKQSTDQKYSATVSAYNRQFKNEPNLHQPISSINEACKILTKCLQGLENLIASIRKVGGNDQQQQTTNAYNWLQTNNTYFQLADILNTAKALCTYGISSRLNNSTRSANQNPVLVKSEPVKLEESSSNVKPARTAADPNELSWRRSEGQGSFTNGNNQQQKSKRYTKTNHSNKGGQQQQPSNEAGASNHTNSVQCLREVHVPLVQYQKEGVSNDTDSDISDTNSNASSNLNTEKAHAKIRIAAFGVLLTAFQSVDKRALLSFWDSFLVSNKTTTNSSKPKSYSLIWSIRNDSSPKVRLIASNTLAIYLEHAKAFFTLTAAEELSQPVQAKSQFIPISLSIARLIREIHKELLVSLCNLESFSLNQVQLLKCLQALIRATPYQKLKPGLIYKLIINLNCFLKQKTPDNRNALNKMNQNSANLISEVLRTILLLLTNYHDVAEVHLALLSPVLKEKSILTTEVDHLSSRLEQLSNRFKVPNVTQSRVTYFYTSDAENTSTKASSQSDSLVTSGQLTPLLNDLILGESKHDATSAGNKSWLVVYSLHLLDLDINQETGKSSIANQNLNKVRAVALELLQIVCKKYFDLLRRDLFFDDLCQLVLNLIEFGSTSLSAVDSGEQLVLQKTLKFLEEFARCLATDELIARNNVDLSDCCRFWLSLLNSKLVSQLLCDEQYYLLSSSACDCLASIGASIFELLPFQKRIYCLTNLLHLTKSKSTLIRSSSVRALGVYVTFTSLKEDQTFLNDLSQSLQDLLSNDTNNLVRQKTAWSLSNLSEVLVENRDKLGKAFTDEFSLNVWLSLLDTASHACLRESDKLKSYLVRTLGNLISYITVFDVEYLEREINRSKLEASIGRGIDSLCQCRHVKMLKVKWNLSHAIGVSMRKFSTWKLQLLNPSWLQMFYSTLLDLFTESSNFKVRINACIALMTVNLYDRGSIGIELDSTVTGQLSSKNALAASNQEPIYLQLWISLVGVFSKLYAGEHVIDESNEVQHKASLFHQLCKFVTYLCKYLRLEDMDSLLSKCLNKVKQTGSIDNQKFISSHELRRELLTYIKTIFDQIETNKQEVQLYNEALTHLNLLNSKKETSGHEDCINYLIGLLQKSDKVGQGGSKKTRNEESDSTTSDIGGCDQNLVQDLADLDPNEFMKSGQATSAEFVSFFPNFKKTYD